MSQMRATSFDEPVFSPDWFLALRPMGECEVPSSMHLRVLAEDGKVLVLELELEPQVPLRSSSVAG